MVSEDYLKKIRFAVRRAEGDELVDAELTDLIEAAREDMTRKGVPKDVAESEENRMVLGAVRGYARWRFGIGGDDAEANHAAYDLDVEQLRKTAVPSESGGA